MMRYQIRAQAQKVEKNGNVISGLALPYGVEASPIHPSFSKGMLVDYGYTRPLLVEHDITQIAGDVVKLYEGDDGVYFVAVKNVNSEFSGVSIGAEYWVDENGAITSLYIHEISLTNNPAYPTYYSIVANNEINQQKEKNMETMKAQDLNLVMQELEALRDRVTELENRVTQMENVVVTINEEIASLKDTTSLAIEASTKTLDAAKEELVKHQEMLSSQLNASLNGIVESLEKLIKLKK